VDGRRSRDGGGGYYEGDESASGNAYTLVRKGGKWLVTKDVTRWVS
jgi:hypothetical protein